MGTIEKVEMFKVSDGTLWKTYAEAERADFEIRRIEWIQKWVDRCGDSYELRNVHEGTLIRFAEDYAKAAEQLFGPKVRVIVEGAKG